MIASKTFPAIASQAARYGMENGPRPWGRKLKRWWKDGESLTVRNGEVTEPNDARWMLGPVSIVFSILEPFLPHVS